MELLCNAVQCNNNESCHRISLSIHRVMVYIKQPGMESTTFGHVLRPFSLELWVTIVGAIILTGHLLSFAWNMGLSHGKPDTCDNAYNLLESCFCVLSSFCQQGE
jgi:hypothetical protein